MVADEAAAMRSKRRLVWPPATTHPLPARVPGMRRPRHPVPMCRADDTARVRADRCHKHARRNLRRRPVHDYSRPLRRRSALARCNAHHKSSARLQPAPRTAAAALAGCGGDLPAESGRVHDLRGWRRQESGASEPSRLKNGSRSAWWSAARARLSGNRRSLAAPRRGENKTEPRVARLLGETRICGGGAHRSGTQNMNHPIRNQLLLSEALRPKPS